MRDTLDCLYCCDRHKKFEFFGKSARQESVLLWAVGSRELATALKNGEARSALGEVVLSGEAPCPSKSSDASASW